MIYNLIDGAVCLLGILLLIREVIYQRSLRDRDKVVPNAANLVAGVLVPPAVLALEFFMPDHIFVFLLLLALSLGGCWLILSQRRGIILYDSFGFTSHTILGRTTDHSYREITGLTYGEDNIRLQLERGKVKLMDNSRGLEEFFQEAQTQYCRIHPTEKEIPWKKAEKGFRGWMNRLYGGCVKTPGNELFRDLAPVLLLLALFIGVSLELFPRIASGELPLSSLLQVPGAPLGIPLILLLAVGAIWTFVAVRNPEKHWRFIRWRFQEHHLDPEVLKMIRRKERRHRHQKRRRRKDDRTAE